MITIKIGGVIFEKEKNFSNLLDIINLYSNNSIFFVISAFGKTSHTLRNCIELILNNQHKKSNTELKKLKSFYFDLMKSNNLTNNNYITQIESLFTQLSDLYKGVKLTNECSDKIWSKILAQGEIISSKIIYFYLLENLNSNIQKIKWILATELLTTSPDYRKAKPNLIQSKAKYKKIITNQNHEIIISQGFFGANDQNEICTMGFESSNLSACIIGQISKSKRIIFVSDVEGIRTRGPKYFKNHKLITHIDYNTAETLGKLGLKLLIPSMIKFAKDYNLDIQFHSYQNYDDNYSLISNKETPNTTEIIIPDKDNNKITLYGINIDTLNTVCNNNYFKINLNKILFESKYLILELNPKTNFEKACLNLEELL